ncbi:hypothetical protein vseg_020603 [Gypsophila vaccaria]
MEGSFSPLLRKLTREIVSKPKLSFTVPTEVCLEDWWLSKPSDGEGIAISGCPIELRKCDDAVTKFNIASPKRRYASREFHSTKVVKRHGSTMLETFDGLLISLCSFINKSRTQQNGFSSEVCRDFLYGFPFNWEDYTTQSTDEELKISEKFIQSFTPDILGSFNGAQLHDYVLSLTDQERELLVERLDNNLTLNLQASLHGEQCSTSAQLSLLDADISGRGITNAGKNSIQNAATDNNGVQSSYSSSTSRVCISGETADCSATNASKKQRLNSSVDVSPMQDLRRSKRKKIDGGL